MKVILLQDVAKVGKKFDIKEVNDGYGRNFLIAQGKARAVTDSSKEAIEKLKAGLDTAKKVQDDLLLMNLSKISETVLTVKAKANPEGHLFAGVHKKEIVAALLDQMHISLSEELIDLEKPIKKAGKYEVVIGPSGQQVKLRLDILGS